MKRWFYENKKQSDNVNTNEKKLNSWNPCINAKCQNLII